MEIDGNTQALTSIHNKLSQLSKPQTQPFIHRVHKPLRNINPRAYEPETIAIGPYHHGKDDLKMMEEHKVRYLDSLLQRNNENVERYISAVAELEQEARDCYAEPISLKAAEFVEMLVLDGCFIIELILKNQGSTSDNDPIFETRWMSSCIKRDLILFENQIPFFVLCKLLDLIVAPNQHDWFMNTLLNFFLVLSPVEVMYNRTSRSSGEVKHLLDLVQSVWPPPLDASPSSKRYRRIHNVTALKDANVKFRKRESESLFEVKFENGIIQIPPLTIHDMTESFFRNLIAYEQYFPHDKHIFVTEYVVLMDSLINSSRDVEILSRCGIIDNLLGDDKVVANMFNRLSDSVTYAAEHFVYAETFHRINTHYEKRWNRAWAVLNRDYFNSPWAYISFFGALLLLLLTLAQTVFSALQAN